MVRRLIFSILLIVICAHVVYSQGQMSITNRFEKDKWIIEGTKVIGSDVSVSVNIQSFLAQFPAAINVRGARLYVGFDMGDQFTYGMAPGQGDFTIKIDRNVRGLNAQQLDLFTYTSLPTCTLTSAIPECGYWSDISGGFGNLASINISSLQKTVLTNTTTSIANNTLLASLRVKVRVELDLGIDATTAQVISPAVSITGKEVQFSWNTLDGKIYPNYEIQVMKLNNSCYSSVAADDETSIKAVLDWSTALTIETQKPDKFYNLFLSEGQGYYAWRIRTVGTLHTGGYANIYNYGNQFGPSACGTCVCSSNSITNPLLCIDLTLSNLSCYGGFVFYYTDNDDDKNYIHTRVFAEEGKKKDVINYGTYLGQLKQSQTFLPSIGAKIVAQNVYDYSNRPSISLLPLPMPNQTLDGYVSNMLKATNGNLYTADNFDNNTNYLNPEPATGLINSYYDGVNNDAGYPIPSAGGYPFARTILSEDGTGRHKESSGIGGDLMIGSGRTTTTAFSMPSEMELIRIFGDEAPSAEDVMKTSITDPNNTTSITYTDKSGKVIATCLAYSDAPSASLVETSPDGTSTGSGTTITDKVTTNNNDGNDIVSRKRVSLSQESDLYVSYKKDCSPVNSGCATGDCKYKIIYTITDVNNPALKFSTVAKNVACVDGEFEDFAPDWENAACQKCSSGVATTLPYGPIQVVTNSGSIGLHVPAGTYDIEKRLIIDNGASTVATQTDPLEVQAYMQIVSRVLGTVVDEDSYDDFIDLIQAANIDPLDPAYFDITDKTGGEGGGPDGESDYDFEGFEIAYNPTTNEMSINTGSSSCCGSNTYSMNGFTEPKAYECEPDKVGNWKYYDGIENELPEVGKDVMDFWGYMEENLEEIIYQQLVQKGVSPDADARTEAHAKATAILLSNSGNMQGYDQQQFNAMIFHMLNDRYYTGRAVYESGVWYKADDLGEKILPADPIGEEDMSVQYSCKDVWDCWISVVSSYSSALTSFSDDTFYNNKEDNQMDPSENADQSSGSDPAEDTHDDQFDNNEEIDAGPFVKWLADRKTSQIMRDLKVDVQMDLVYKFLDCVGYKFAQVAVFNNGNSCYQYNITDDPEFFYMTSSGTPIYQDVTNVPPGDLNKYHPKAVQDENSYINSSTCYSTNLNIERAVQTSIEDHELDKQLTDRVFAFKYFSYNNTNVGAPINNTSSEVATCFYANTVDNPPYTTDMCTPVKCKYGYPTWSSGQRATFYSIEKYGAGEIEPSEEMDPDAPLSCEGEEADAARATYVANNNDRCNTACDNRRPEFRAAIIAKLKERCYVIGCPGEPYGVSYDEIEAMVTKLVAECKNTCTITDDDLDCFVTECTPAYGYSSPIIYRELKLKTACKKLLIEQARYWQFDIDFNPAHSGCDVNYGTSLFASTSTSSVPVINTNSANSTIPVSNAGCSPSNTSGSTDYDYSPVKIIEAP